MSYGTKLLFLIADEYPTHRADVAVLFGRELPRHGITCDLVGQFGRGAPPDDGRWPAGRAMICGRTGNRVRDQIVAFWHDCRCLWSARAGAYDAIQVRDKVFAGVLGLVRARQLKVPFLFWMSFPMSEGFIEIARREGRSLGWMRWAFMWLKGHVGRWLIYRFLLPRCDHVFAQSETMAGNLCQRGVRRERVSVVPMGVDVREISGAEIPDHRFTQDPAGGPVIAYLGSLDRSRGLDFLFEVLVSLRERFPSACLRLVGEANEEADRQWLKGKAKALGLDGAVVWTGWLPRAKAWSFVRDADVAVSLVPRGELFDCSSPTKVVEYLALGVPVVANDLPDQHRVLTESGAGISVPASVPDFVAAIVRILEQPALAAAMRRAGPTYVQSQRSYSVIGERVAATYRRVLEGTGLQTVVGDNR